MPTTTVYRGYTKPDLNQTGWGTLINTDWDQVDADVNKLFTRETPQIVTALTNTTLDMSTGFSKVITLTTNVTLAVTGQADGNVLNLLIKMGAGGFTLAFPGNFIKAPVISTANANNAAGIVASMSWRYDAASTNWYIKVPLIY